MSEDFPEGRKPFVTLGDVDYPIVPLTLGVLKRIGIGAAKQNQRAFLGMPGTDPAATMDPVQGETNWYEGTSMVLCAALGKTPAEVEELPGVTLAQLVAALRVIFKLTGLIPAEGAKPAKPAGEETGA